MKFVMERGSVHKVSFLSPTTRWYLAPLLLDTKQPLEEIIHPLEHPDTKQPLQLLDIIQRSLSLPVCVNKFADRFVRLLVQILA